MVKRWIPLESNPDVMNEFVQKLGMDISQYQFQDVFSLDEELLAMVPKPALAVLLLFPISDATEKAKEEEEKSLKDKGATTPPGVFYMKQTIGNACGTIGLLHAVGNNQEKLTFEPGSFLAEFMSRTATMDPEERGKYLEDPPEGELDIEATHQEMANMGQTTAPPEDECPDLHFVAIINKDGHVYELDGRKHVAVDHGASQNEGDLLRDAAVVVRQFMDRAQSLNFNVIALAPPPSE